MASATLYPPRLQSKLPTFVVDENGVGTCIVPFELSKYYSGNVNANQTTAHIRVTKQSTGVNCVNSRSNSDLGNGWYNSYKSNTNDASNEELRNGVTGIILDVTINSSDNGYYVILTNNDIEGGWTINWVYKIQIRLCNAAKYYSERENLTPTQWLSSKADMFSEWSTIGIVKATGQPSVSVPGINLEYPKSLTEQNNVINYFDVDNFILSGKYGNKDKTEFLKNYRVRIYNTATIPIDEQGVKEYPKDLLVEDSLVRTNVITTEHLETSEDLSQFEYISSYEPLDGESYCIRYTFITINDLEFEVLKENVRINDRTAKDKIRLYIDDIDDINEYVMSREEGRMPVKVTDSNSTPFTGNYVIRRACQDTNFLKWEDMAITSAFAIDVDKLPTFYDYTIESGKYYVYGIAAIDTSGFRGALRKAQTPVMVEYDYSYLLGADGRQLKLMFNNTMDNFKINVAETKVDTIGSKYPIITRNARIEYRTFPINGLISFQMDENKLFYTKSEAFSNSYTNDEFTRSISDYLNAYNNNQEELFNKSNAGQYDYIWEKQFREKVLEWLHDGTVKLFKSPTEGNILVRLMDINCSPNATLGRMIYSFTATAHEIAECNYENMVKYGIIKVGEYATNFAQYQTKIGQLYGNFATLRNLAVTNDEGTTTTYSVGDNILELIYDKYDSTGKNMAGYKINLHKIYGLKFTIHTPFLRIKRPTGRGVDSDLVLGHKFLLEYNEMAQDIVMYAPHDIYEFDNDIVFTLPRKNDNLLAEKIYFYGEEPLNDQNLIDQFQARVTVLENEQNQWAELLTRDLSDTDSYAYLSSIPRRYLTYAQWRRWIQLYNQELNYEKQYGTYYGLLMQIQSLKDQIEKIKYGMVDQLEATIDFLYKVEINPYEEKKIRQKRSTPKLGQIFQTMESRIGNEQYTWNQDGTLISGIRSELLSRYYLYLDLEGDVSNQPYSKMIDIRSISIEADPGAVFGIIDEFDSVYEIHDMNYTGVLELYELSNLYNILFLGYRMPDGSLQDTYTENGIVKPAYCDVTINYIIDFEEGIYD